MKRFLPHLGFLVPRGPQDALALALLCSLLLAAGAGALKWFESLTAEDPWYVRADRICLEVGDEYLAVDGRPTEQLRTRVELTDAALDHLRAVGGSVPLESTLEFQTMLSEKATTLRLLKRELHLAEEDKSVASVESDIRSEYGGVYGATAERLGLHVCGQGTGRQ